MSDDDNTPPSISKTLDRIFNGPSTSSTRAPTSSPTPLKKPLPNDSKWTSICSSLLVASFGGALTGYALLRGRPPSPSANRLPVEWALRCGSFAFVYEGTREVGMQVRCHLLPDVGLAPSPAPTSSSPLFPSSAFPSALPVPPPALCWSIFDSSLGGLLGSLLSFGVGDARRLLGGGIGIVPLHYTAIAGCGLGAIAGCVQGGVGMLEDEMRRAREEEIEEKKRKDKEAGKTEQEATSDVLSEDEEIAKVSEHLMKIATEDVNEINRELLEMRRLAAQSGRFDRGK